MGSLLDPELTFAALAEATGLDVRLRKAVSRLGHIRPTLVQSKCLPLAISSGRDLMVRAKTGSGKTLAYCLPVLQKILVKKMAAESSQQQHANRSSIQAIILVPTRELCTQVHRTLQSLIYYCDDMVTVALLSASQGRGKKAREEMTRQEAMLRDRPDIVVATPTGLATHIQSGAVYLKTSVETLVVDEADLVLSFGHENAVHEIIKALPKIYQGFLMSATLSAEVNSIKKVVLHSPVVLKLEEDEDEVGVNRRLKQFYVCLPKKDKALVVYVFLKLGLLKGKGLFFVNTTDAAYRLKLMLEQFHIRSSVLNGELPIHSRLNIIEQFNVGNFDFLIATDESANNTVDSNVVDDDDDDDDDDKKRPKKSKKRDAEYGVSRGLDFRNVSFVVNVDFPMTPKSYAHRVGRTARGGGTGVALSLVDINSDVEMSMLQQVQEDQPEVPLAGTATDRLQAAPTDGGDIDEENTTIVSAAKTQAQPAPLDFDLKEIEGFRYRVEDVSRAVTRVAVKETRAAELKAEILNSERLQSHFEDNPTDLQLLRHDRVATHISKVQDHLKHVPKYLLPRGMQVAKLNKKRKKKKARMHGCREDNDPLRSFDGAIGDVGLGGVAGQDEEADDLEGFFDDDDDGGDAGQKKQKSEETESKLYTSTRDGTGKSSAGRQQWKERHRKGKFSGKKRKSEKKNWEPLGI